MIFIGSNAAEAHPVAMQHVLAGKEINRANWSSWTRASPARGHATEYVRFRPARTSADLGRALARLRERLGGQGIHRPARYGIDEVPQEVAKWTPEEVERVTGVPGEQVGASPKCSPRRSPRPSSGAWARRRRRSARQRAGAVHRLPGTGNVGKPGTGANIFRGHTNVQGATDLGLDIANLPLYYGLTEAAWKHWGRVWEIEYEWLQSRFDEVPPRRIAKPRTRKENMETPGITSTRWFDGVLIPEEEIDQRSNIKGMFIMGHGGNTVTRIPEMLKAMEKLELLVVVDPHPDHVFGDQRPQGRNLPPAGATSLEMNGSRTASNRSLQWGEKIVEPAFESKDDYEIMYLLAQKLGLASNCSRTSRSRTTSRSRKISSGRSIGAAGRPAIAGSRPSASRRTWRTRTSSTL
jgi:formate dehydrogenase major subunit